MHQLATIFVVVALASLLDGGLAAKLPRKSLINTMDNEISVNSPSSVVATRRNFIDIEEPPASARHTVGGTTQLFCEAIGSPMPHIEWLKNDMPILEEMAENNEILDVSQNSMARTRSTLIINTASPNKEDVYTCIAQAGVMVAEASAKVYNEPAQEAKSYTDVLSLNRHLLAAPMKPVITEYLKVLMDDTNVNVLLPCRARGNPTPDIYWHNEDNHLILNMDPRIRVLESGELFITAIRWTDMGGYTCTAKNAFGKESVTTFLYPVIGEKKKMKKF